MRRLRQGNNWCAPTCIAMLLNISRAKARLLLDENYDIHHIRDTLLNLGYSVTNWRYLYPELDLNILKNNALIIYDWSTRGPIRISFARHMMIWDAKAKIMRDPQTWAKPIEIKRYSRRWYALVK